MGRVRGFARGFLVTVEQLRQLVDLANREVSCDHWGEIADQCDECKPVEDAKVELMWKAPAALPALLDIAEAAEAVETGDVEALLRIGGSVEHRGYTHRTPDDFELTGDYQEDARYILPARDKLIEQALRAALSLLDTDEGEDDAKDRGRDPASDQ